MEQALQLARRGRPSEGPSKGALYRGVESSGSTEEVNRENLQTRPGKGDWVPPSRIMGDASEKEKSAPIRREGWRPECGPTDEPRARPERQEKRQRCDVAQPTNDDGGPVRAAEAPPPHKSKGTQRKGATTTLDLHPRNKQGAVGWFGGRRNEGRKYDTMPKSSITRGPEKYPEKGGRGHDSDTGLQATRIGTEGQSPKVM